MSIKCTIEVIWRWNFFLLKISFYFILFINDNFCIEEVFCLNFQHFKCNGNFCTFLLCNIRLISCLIYTFFFHLNLLPCTNQSASVDYHRKKTRRISENQLWLFQHHWENYLVVSVLLSIFRRMNFNWMHFLRSFCFNHSIELFYQTKFPIK